MTTSQAINELKKMFDFTTEFVAKKFAHESAEQQEQRVKSLLFERLGLRLPA